jgi:hypothetical protein
MPSDLKERIEPDRIDKRQRDLMICWFLHHPEAIPELEQIAHTTKERSFPVIISFEMGDEDAFRDFFLD